METLFFIFSQFFPENQHILAWFYLSRSFPFLLNQMIVQPIYRHSPRSIKLKRVKGTFAQKIF
jgi:hypothetical protein